MKKVTKKFADISTREIEDINSTNERFENFVKAIDYSKKMGVGNVYTITRNLSSWDYNAGMRVETMTLDKHDTGIYRDQTCKYKVVYKDDCGVAHLKELLPNGNYGWLFSINDYIEEINTQEIVINNDSAQLDAAILGGDYDPLEAFKTIKAAAEVRAEHNKKIRVHNSKPDDALKFVEDIKVGDSYWISTRSQYTCESVDEVSISDFVKSKGNLSSWRREEYKRDLKKVTGNKFLGGMIKVITWKSTSGRTSKHSVTDIMSGKFYTEQPNFRNKKREL